ncbi:DUF3489 domain-containing protein [Thermithiobacillus plumbiphilus]|uniref:DUF3489 domain-containing protein n=1 Tax=Thermithiobacillus plumbiphilus TaxID=1729899 RepID=A0ABU9D6S3_9PROT
MKEHQMSTIQLTPAQHAILAYAVEHTGGKIEWFPDNVKGGARKKVLDGLCNRALITTIGPDWFVAADGYEALGRPRPAPAPAPVEADADLEAEVAAAEATWAPQRAETKPRTRENSKQAQVIAMLRRPEGATVRQICELTGWQAHTVRGTFANAFKKMLGLTITSDKPEGGERIYRIA